MDHSAAPIFDTLVNYHAHGRYRFAPPDTVKAAMRIREAAARSARLQLRQPTPKSGTHAPCLHTHDHVNEVGY